MPKYDLFISYHHDASHVLAKAFQTWIQKFAKPWWRYRAIRVFRDATDLGAGTGGWSRIAAELGDSNFLLLMASPAAAKSKWVRREVRHFLTNGRDDGSDPDILDEPLRDVCEKRRKRFLVGHTSGTMVWRDARGGKGPSDYDWDKTDALPRLLRGVFDEEPIWIDLTDRSMIPGRSDPKFIHAVARISSAVRGIELHKLVSEDYRQHRNTIRTAWTAVGLISVLAIGASLAAYLANIGKEAAEASNQRSLEAADVLLEQVAENMRVSTAVSSDRVRNVFKVSEELLQSLAGDLLLDLEYLDLLDRSKCLRSASSLESCLSRLFIDNKSDELVLLQGRALSELGFAYLRLGDAKAALARGECAVDLILQTRTGGEDKWERGNRTRELARAKVRLGNIRRDADDHDGARAEFESAILLINDWISRSGAATSSSAASYWLAKAYNHLSELDYLAKDFNAMETSLEHAASAIGVALEDSDRFEAVQARDLRLLDVDIKIGQGDIWQQRAITQSDEKMKFKQLQKAQEMYSEAIKAVRARLNEYGGLVEWIRINSLAFTKRAWILEEKGELENAIMDYKESLKYYHELKERDNSNVKFLFDYQLVRYKLSRARSLHWGKERGMGAWNKLRVLLNSVAETADRQLTQSGVLADNWRHIRVRSRNQEGQILEYMAATFADEASDARANAATVFEQNLQDTLELERCGSREDVWLKSEEWNIAVKFLAAYKNWTSEQVVSEAKAESGRINCVQMTQLSEPEFVCPNRL